MRWQDEAEEAAKAEGYEVIDTAGVNDYQGWGVLLLRGGSYGFAILSWSYGSCGYCDGYEGKPTSEVVDDMRRDIQTFATEAEAREAFGSNKGW